MEPMEENSIKKFYDGAEIFITGGSGFVGKALVEKLLRTCSGIKTIYLLMRLKKDASGQQRIQQLTNNLLYKGLLETQPSVIEKLHVIEGDASKMQLGISKHDREKLKSCSVIFHAAASVRFDDPLKSAILLNTRGTREVCELARTMPNLKGFVHVSTAYVQPKNLLVDEKIYPAEADWRTYIDYAENLDEDLINLLTLKMTRFAPNTYTFTKHMAEHICIDYKKQFNLPMTIVRPSIVTATECEPISGWLDNLNGPMGLVMVGAIGVNNVVGIKGSREMNMVPVDICVKGLIIASYNIWKDKLQMDVPVYNAASIKLVTYLSMMDVSKRIQEAPSMKAIGPPNVTFTSCVYYAWLVRIFRNIIPAIILDGLLCISGQKPKMLKIHRIIYNADVSLRYFSTRIFKIVNHNFNDLHLTIPPHEKQDFFINETVFSNSELYHLTYLITLQEVFKESPDDLPKARRRFFYVKLITNILHSLTLFIAFWALNKIALIFL